MLDIQPGSYWAALEKKRQGHAVRSEPQLPLLLKLYLFPKNMTLSSRKVVFVYWNTKGWCWSKRQSFWCPKSPSQKRERGQTHLSSMITTVSFVGLFKVKLAVWKALVILCHCLVMMQHVKSRHCKFHQSVCTSTTLFLFSDTLIWDVFKNFMSVFVIKV